MAATAEISQTFFFPYRTKGLICRSMYVSRGHFTQLQPPSLTWGKKALICRAALLKDTENTEGYSLLQGKEIRVEE